MKGEDIDRGQIGDVILQEGPPHATSAGARGPVRSLRCGAVEATLPSRWPSRPRRLLANLGVLILIWDFDSLELCSDLARFFRRFPVNHAQAPLQPTNVGQGGSDKEEWFTRVNVLGRSRDELRGR